MNVNDVPDEVHKWLMERKEPYAIFFDTTGQLTLVSGVDTPRMLWEYYTHGGIQSWLEGEGKEQPSLGDYEESWMIPMENPVCNVAEIADLLRVPKRSIYFLVKHASMPHFREGRKLKFRLFEVMHWRGELMGELERRGLAPKQPLETA